MRVIKLSPDDVDMKDRDSVDRFFRQHLAKRDPAGQFLLTSGRIAADGVSPGEILVFSYLGEVVYLGIAESRRLSTEGADAAKYPFYFCVSVDSIRNGKGLLSDLESDLRHAQLLNGNIVRSQGWPIVSESGTNRARIEQILERFKDAG